MPSVVEFLVLSVFHRLMSLSFQKPSCIATYVDAVTGSVEGLIQNIQSYEIQRLGHDDLHPIVEGGT